MLVVGALMLSSCFTGYGSESMGPQRPEPDMPAEGPVIASVDVDGTSFVMHDESDGQVAVEIIHPGLQTTVERALLNDWNTLRETSTCGWLADPVEEAPGDCDVELPRVFYGRVTDPDVGYVCVGAVEHFEQDPGFGVTGARFLTRDEDGYILEAAQPGEGAAPHLLTVGGSRVGDPPLDAPSGPIYEACEAATGVEEFEAAVWVDLSVRLDESLRQGDRLVVMVLGGLHRGGISAGAFEGDEAVPITFGVTPTAHRFTVAVVDENDSEPIVSTDLVWPDEIYELLAADERCTGLTMVELTLGAGVLDGDEDAIDVRFVGSECSIGGKPPEPLLQPSEMPTTVGASAVPSLPSTASGANLCPAVEELYPGANEIPENGRIVGEFGFRDGVVFLVRDDQSDVTYFSVVECFSGGGEGFSGGGPGETWQGCHRVDYSDAGYAIVIVEDPSWSVAVNGEPVDIGQTGDGLGAVLIEGSFDRPPSVEVLTDGACG